MSYGFYAENMPTSGASLGLMGLLRFLAWRGLAHCPAAKCLSTFNCETGAVLPASKVRAAANSILLCTVADVAAWMDKERADEERSNAEHIAEMEAALAKDPNAMIHGMPMATALKNTLHVTRTCKHSSMEGTPWSWAVAAAGCAEWLLEASNKSAYVEFVG